MIRKQTLSCPPRTAVAYARYSSAGQKDVSIDQQLRDIYAYAQREGYTIVREYADHARSGFKDISARSEFQAMIAASASGSFDTILCWKNDRFSRKRSDAAIYKEQLASRGVSVISVMEPVPDGAAGVITVGMLEVMAEWYSRNLSENVTRGMLDNATKCLFNGTRIIGYIRGDDNHYQINEQEAPVVRDIFSRYRAGYSAASIAKHLNSIGLQTTRNTRWTIQSVLRVISNERYAGVYIWGDVRIPDGMPAIISHDDWEAAQLMKKKTTRHYENHPADFILTGKAFCGHCGRAMIGTSGTSHTGTTHYYYSCQGRNTRSGCVKQNHRKDDLENVVINFIFDNCFSDEQINRIADIVMAEMEERKKKSPLAKLKQELNEVTSKINNIVDAIENGIWNSTTSQRLTELETKQEELKKQVGFQEYAEKQMLDRDRVLFFIRRFQKLRRDNPEDRKKLINFFINAVYVYDDHLKIVVNTTEGTTRVPLESLPDSPPGSNLVMSGVLTGTHQNPYLLYTVRI